MTGRFTEVSASPASPPEEDLLEREPELQHVRHGIARAEAGEGSVTVVHGPAGMGKTCLLDAARREAEAAGADVLAAAGRELESDFSFGVALQLFEARVARAERQERDRLLSGAARLATPLLAEGPRDPLPEGQAFSLFHGLYWLCSNLAEERPLVLLVDDAHWADEPSLRFLLYLAQRVGELPVAVVLGSTTVSRARAPETLPELVEHPATIRLGLGPLSADGVATWLKRSHFPNAHRRFCQACHQATGGNPFLLRELALELVENGVEPKPKAAARVAEFGPESIASTVLGRVSRLGSGAPDLACALAVAGDGAAIHHCAALAGLDPAPAAHLADELGEADVFERTDELAFVHPIVRQAVYASMSPAERAEAHLRLAKLLRSEGEADERLAAHLQLAARTGSAWVVETLCEAAATAVSRGVPGAAVNYLRRALEEPPAPEARARVIVELGRAEAMAGDGAAVDRLSSAVPMIEDPRQRGLTSLDIGRALYAQGRLSDAAAAFRAGAEQTGEADRDLRLQLHTAYVLVSRVAGLPVTDADRTVSSREAIEKDAEATPTGRVLLAHFALEEAFRGSPRAEVRRLAETSLARGALLEQETSDGLAPYFAAAALIIAEDLQAAEIALATMVEDARSRGSVLGFATACFFRSWAELNRGRIDDAAADAQNALAAERYGWRLGLPGAHAILANAFMARGEPAAAGRELELGQQAAEQSGEAPLPLLRMTRAYWQLGAGQPGAALELFRDCGRRLEAAGTTNPSSLPWRSGAALAAARTGDREEAFRLLDEDERLAREFGAPGAIGRSLFVRGILLETDGIDVLRQSADMLAESQLALDRARCLVALGTALRQAGKRREARDPLREGLDLAERCGARALAKRALDEVRTAGARPRRSVLRGVEALTPRERQVAGLAAQGMSNREIAEALFVTLKTVEWHLRHTFEKLDVGSRTEMRAVLAGQPAKPATGSRV